MDKVKLIIKERRKGFLSEKVYLNVRGGQYNGRCLVLRSREFVDLLFDTDSYRNIELEMEEHTLDVWKEFLR